MAHTGAAVQQSARATASAEAALALEEISKRWPGTTTPVLRSVDLVLPPGSATHLSGNNGVGKTTLLRIAAGLIEPDSGRVSGFGLDPFRDRREFQRRVGYLSAGSIGLYARLSPRDHLELQTRLALLPRSRRDRAAERELERFELGEVATRRTDRLSMGQRQRLRLALTMVVEPSLVLLDEPHSSLDDHGALLLAAALEKTLERDGAVLSCSPQADDLGVRLDQGLVLREGELWST